MKCFIGLGNPGKEYMYNRHNVGFMAIDKFASVIGVSSYQDKGKYLLADQQYLGQKVILLKPMTYMNLSGEAVRKVVDYYKLQLADLVVLYDDLDIPFGQLRLRLQGSSGGHNGIKSLIQHLGTEHFSRIRIGISRPQPGVAIADYVLSNFTTQENPLLPDILHRCSQAMSHCVAHPFETTMGIYNCT